MAAATAVTLHTFWKTPGFPYSLSALLRFAVHADRTSIFQEKGVFSRILYLQTARTARTANQPRRIACQLGGLGVFKRLTTWPGQGQSSPES